MSRVVCDVCRSPIKKPGRSRHILCSAKESKKHLVVEKRWKLPPAATEKRVLVATKKRSLAQQAATRKAQETRAEQIQFARAEVAASHPDLLPWFDKTWMQLKKQPYHSSLAETFLERVERDPAQAQAYRARHAQKQAERDIARIESAYRGPEYARQRLEHLFCEKAKRLGRARRPLVIKRSLRQALEAVGSDPRELATECYLPRGRVISGKQPAPRVVFRPNRRRVKRRR